MWCSPHHAGVHYFPKLNFIDCLWDFSLGSKVHIHHSSLHWVSDFHSELQKQRPASLFLLYWRESMWKIYGRYEGEVSLCEWRSFTSDVQAANKTHSRKTEEQRFSCQINSVMGKLTSCSCHTGNNIQNKLGQLVITTSHTCIPIIHYFFHEVFTLQRLIAQNTGAKIRFTVCQLA